MRIAFCPSRKIATYQVCRVASPRVPSSSTHIAFYPSRYFLSEKSFTEGNLRYTYRFHSGILCAAGISLGSNNFSYHFCLPSERKVERLFKILQVTGVSEETLNAKMVYDICMQFAQTFKPSSELRELIKRINRIDPSTYLSIFHRWKNYLFKDTISSIEITLRVSSDESVLHGRERHGRATWCTR